MLCSRIGNFSRANRRLSCASFQSGFVALERANGSGQEELEHPSVQDDIDVFTIGYFSR